MSEITVIHKAISVNADSLTIGTPTLGQVKVYGDFSKADEFRAKIAAALKEVKAAREIENGGPK